MKSRWKIVWDRKGTMVKVKKKNKKDTEGWIKSKWNSIKKKVN